jgi:hypothetical protein
VLSVDWRHAFDVAERAQHAPSELVKAPAELGRDEARTRSYAKQRLPIEVRQRLERIECGTAPALRTDLESPR